jgi:hypothetical protein
VDDRGALGKEVGTAVEEVQRRQRKVVGRGALQPLLVELLSKRWVEK